MRRPSLSPQCSRRDRALRTCRSLRSVPPPQPVSYTHLDVYKRQAPDYVLRLLEYYIRNEGLMVKEMNEGGGDSEKEAT